jgi:hypothetical protein
MMKERNTMKTKNETPALRRLGAFVSAALSVNKITIGALALLSVAVSVPAQQAPVQDKASTAFVAPIVFQAAGPTIASIQSSVDAYRAALGSTNHGNAPGPFTSGRREINWDGGSTTNQATTVSGNPFAGFQVTRGALFTTPDGTGFVQAPPAGLAVVFNNPTYETIFTAFSPQRLFSAIGSRVTDVDFFVPGGGNIPATVTGFGAVFTDVDQPDGSGPAKKQGNRKASTRIDFYAADGELLFTSSVPASPGDGSVSFLGIVFEDARIAAVRIVSGNAEPGANDGGRLDVVMMDDFLYGEPQPLH